MTAATSITDAGFCPRLRIGSYAAWVRVDGVSRPIRMSGVLRSITTSSNEAELYAALCGVWAAHRHGATRVLVQTDSFAVVQAVRRQHRLYTDVLYAGLEAHCPGVTLTAKHVKGHTDDPSARSWVNRWCDEQCRFHLTKERSAHGYDPAKERNRRGKPRRP